jgi:Group 4 capsule polysaccharide lipoprotein gfcB, YjbF
MSSHVAIARRIFLVGATGAVCSACGHSFLGDVPSFVQTYFMRGPDLPLTRADVERIPYASIAARLGDGGEALLILGRYDNGELDWISARHEVIVTRRGRVVKTYGLPQDVKATIFLTPDPVGQPSPVLAAARPCERTLDFQPRHQDGVLVRSRFTKIGDEEIEILGEHKATELWEEQGGAAQLGWEFANRYWIDPRTGYVWKSRQWTAPLMPPLDIEVYRPAA